MKNSKALEKIIEHKDGRILVRLPRESILGVSAILAHGEICYLSGNKKTWGRIREKINFNSDDDLVESALKNAKEDGSFKVTREPECGEWIRYVGIISHVEYQYGGYYDHFDENRWKKEERDALDGANLTVRIPFSKFHKQGRPRYIKQVRTYESFHPSDSEAQEKS